MLEMTMELNRQDGGLMLERVTTITIHDEMAFWMRWGMDHIGDENPALSSTLRAFSAGAVSDEDRISRFIEDVERSEFERQMVSLGPMYMNTGLGLDSEELLGDFRAFNELKIEVDLNGQDAVINHPVTLRFSTTELVGDGDRIDLLRNFIVVQPAPLWSEYSLSLTARSSALTALSNSIVRESEAFDFSVLRMPWGDVISMEGEGIEQGETFSLSTLPTTSVAYAPLTLSILTLVGLLGAFMLGLRLTRNRRRTYLYIELVLVPIALAVTVIGYPVAFIGIALGAVALIWVITAMASPRLVGAARRCCPSVPQNRMPCMRDTQCGDHGCSSASIQLLRLRSSHQTRRLIKGSNLSGWPPSEPLLGSLPGRNTQQIHHGRQRQRRPADFAPVCLQGHLSGCPKGQLA